MHGYLLVTRYDDFVTFVPRHCVLFVLIVVDGGGGGIILVVVVVDDVVVVVVFCFQLVLLFPLLQETLVRTPFFSFCDFNDVQ